MEGGWRPPKRRRKVETGTTNLQIESCLKGYPATVCCADEIPAHVGVRAPHVHRQYGHVRPRRKSLGGVSLPPRGIRRIFRFAGKRTGNV
jgi:hypothetical protein